jgi:hypothetical protein
MLDHVLRLNYETMSASECQEEGVGARWPKPYFRPGIMQAMSSSQDTETTASANQHTASVGVKFICLPIS